MRKVLLAVTVLLVACVQAARADVNSNAAPADEYFGPYQQSVLEIRNRLDDYDKQDVSAMLDPSVPTYLDHLQLAVRDWQSKYPRDPWLPSILAHLVREYWRAGQSSSDHGMAALADLRSTYPDAPITTQTVALIYGSNGALARVSDDDRPYYGPEQRTVDYPGDGSQVASTLPSYAMPDREPVQNDVAPPYEAAPPQYAAAPAQEAAPPEDPQLVYQAPPAEEDRSVDQTSPADAPAVEQTVLHPSASPSGANASYDAARGYDPVRGYDAARGYDATRGYHVGPNDDAAPAYNTASNTGAGSAAQTGAPPQSPPH